MSTNSSTEAGTKTSLQFLKGKSLNLIFSSRIIKVSFLFKTFQIFLFFLFCSCFREKENCKV